MGGRLRVLELFCGIGGCAAALGDAAEVAAAVDIDQVALSVYTHNFANVARAHSVESLPVEWYAEQHADLWWMSPPCQPYTSRGHRSDLDDPRSESLLALFDRIRQVRPRYLALETVPEFQSSMARQKLLTLLETSGYKSYETQLCPTELGIPNRRRRFYLVGSRDRLRQWPKRNDTPKFQLADVVSTLDDAELTVKPELHAMHREALSVVDSTDPNAIASCFTSEYGRSVMHSGAYLRTSDGIRRFSQQEILSLLGFPATFTFPPAISRQEAWRLVGNSLSIPAVQHVLAAIPELAETECQ